MLLGTHVFPHTIATSEKIQKKSKKWRNKTIKRVTIIDVANAVGVSRQTVSRAINNQDDISLKTKQRVMKAIKKLNYHPNRLAQGMVTNKTRTVGLLVDDINNPYFAEISRSIQDEAQVHNYNIFIYNADQIAEKEIHYLNLLAIQGVDGIIAVIGDNNDDAIRSFLEKYENIPLVMLNNSIEHPRVSTVRVNIFGGAKLAVRYLVNKGHENIGMINSSRESGMSLNRITGFKYTLEAEGLCGDMITADSPSMRGGYQATIRLLEKYPRITAIFSYSDFMALGSMRACYELGRNIPDDISLIGFDNTIPGSMLTPALSTVDTDISETGRQSMRRILEMIDKPGKNFMPLEFDVRLLLRESG